MQQAQEKQLGRCRHTIHTASSMLRPRWNENHIVDDRDQKRPTIHTAPTTVGSYFSMYPAPEDRPCTALERTHHQSFCGVDLVRATVPLLDKIGPAPGSRFLIRCSAITPHRLSRPRASSSLLRTRTSRQSPVACITPRPPYSGFKSSTTLPEHWQRCRQTTGEVS